MLGRGLSGAVTDLLLGYYRDRAHRAHSSTLTELQAACRAGRNARQLVARMPLEVLLDMFSYLEFVDLVHASHVCRYWRAAAVGCPSLWTGIRLRVCGDGSNIDSVNYELLQLIHRSAKMPVHVSLDIGISTRHQPSSRAASTVLFNLAALAQEREKLRAVDINLARPSLVTGWNFVFDGPLSRLHHLTLRFAQANPYADFAQHPSFFACELSELQSLDLSGEFEFPRSQWDNMPALRALSLRKTTGSVDLSMVFQRIVLPCVSLDSLSIYSRHGYYISEPTRRTPLRHPALSLLCVRGNMEGAIPSVLAFVASADIAETAIQRPSAGLAWILHGFDPVELCLFLPPKSGNAAGQRVVAWFSDKRGRSRAEILPVASWALRESVSISEVSKLTVDEALLEPALNTTRLQLRSVQHLTIRLIRTSARAGRPVRFQTAVYRGPDARPLWHCPELQRLDLTLAANGTAAPVMLCNDIYMFLSSTMHVPHATQLGLCGFELVERPGDEPYQRLMRRVSQISTLAPPDALAADRAWASWKIDEDEPAS